MPSLNIATGEVVGRIHRGHRATEFLAFLKEIDGAVPPNMDVHLVIGNYGTHKTAKVRA
jgi:hypothetical protein